MLTGKEAKDRLESLRDALRAQSISYGELAELQSLAEHIEPGDVELLEAAGVPEHTDDSIEDQFAPAIQALQQLLLEDERMRGNSFDECSVYVFDLHGLRVSEVSFTARTETGMFGSSASRSDPGNSALILACEQFLLTFDIPAYRPEGWHSDLDEHADAKWLLQQVLDEYYKPA